MWIFTVSTSLITSLAFAVQLAASATPAIRRRRELLRDFSLTRDAGLECQAFQAADRALADNIRQRHDTAEPFQVASALGRAQLAMLLALAALVLAFVLDAAAPTAVWLLSTEVMLLIWAMILGAGSIAFTVLALRFRARPHG